jgi:ABC-type multidrug transport system fused ATPase/permease subunit
MLNTLRTAIYTQPMLCALPGVMIFITSISFNLLTDGLRSAMDIKMAMRRHWRPDLSPDGGEPARALLEAVELDEDTSPFARGFSGANPGRARCRWRHVFASPGETLGIVGESGCGKSTTARVLMNLIKARRAATILLDGDRAGRADLSLKDFRRKCRWCSRTAPPRSIPA